MVTELGELAQVGDESKQGGGGSAAGSRTALEAVRALPAWAVLVGSAVVFWVVGFLPWIVEGMHLNVSSAWARFDTILGPLVALPFNEYAIPELFVSCVIGGTAALAVSRLAAPEVVHPRLVAGCGAAIALFTSLGQTYFTIRPGLADTNEAKVLVGALFAAVLVSGAFGILVGAWAARGRGWLWLLGAATAAAFSGSWFADLISRSPALDPQWVPQLARWSPWISGILLGVVLAVFGLRPASRLMGWVFGVAIAWVAPSLQISVAYASADASQGTWNRARISEILDAGRDVFVQSLAPNAHVIGPYVAAVLVGVVGSVLLFTREKQPVSGS